MRSRDRLADLLVLAVLAGGISGCATAATPPPPPSTQASTPPSVRTTKDPCTGIENHNIEIGARVSCKWVFVKTNDTGNGNTINWRAAVAGKKVRIVFDNWAVFPDLSCPGDHDVCPSGALNKELHGDTSVDYRYHAYLCDDPAHCSQEIDPGIIIVP